MNINRVHMEMVPVFRARRTAPSTFIEGSEVTQWKTFHSESAAWRWVARGSLFRARRDRCSCGGNYDEDGFCCRYCDPKQYGPIVDRLARILAWRANHIAGGAKRR